MNEALEEFIQVYLTGILSFAVYTTMSSLFKEINKFIDKRNFFNGSKDKNIYQICEGQAEKLMRRQSNENYNKHFKNLLLSQSFSTYYEDFKVKGKDKTYIIQPYQKTKIMNLTKTFIKIDENESFYNKIFKRLFFKESPTLMEGDYISVFGKLNNKEDDEIELYENLPTIKAKTIFKDKNVESLANYELKISAQKILFKFLSFTLILLLLEHQLKAQIIPRFFKFFKRFKSRRFIYCKLCKINTRNILCEKCENLTEFCDNCYSSFQSKIELDQIKLNDIKCPHCNKVLDAVQKLIYN